ncbi:MAG TPA: choice-of-anchor Q domain-containing protein [Lacipirellula sp.]
MGYGKRRRHGRKQTGGLFGKRGLLAKRSVAPPDRRLLSIEPLEDRRVLATFTVTDLRDTFINDEMEVEVFAGSLRAAVNAAEANEDPDVILFAEGLSGTIFLNDGQLEITQNESLRILGPSPTQITISGSGVSRIFYIESEDEEDTPSVEISGVTLSDGNGTGGEDLPNVGGAILNRENLTMREVVIQNNFAPAGGGGIYMDTGRLTMSRSLVMNNSTGGAGGGGLLLAQPEEANTEDPRALAHIVDSTFTNNIVNGTEGFGGAIYNQRGDLLIRQSTIVQNRAENESDGVASQGNLPPKPPEGGMGEPEAQPKTVFTFVLSSIIYHNKSNPLDMEAIDLGVVGAPIMQGEEGMEEEVELEPSIWSLGANIFGTVEDRVENLQTMENADQVGVDPLLSMGIEIFDGEIYPVPDMVYRGGVTPVFYLQEGSPALDMGSTDPAEVTFEGEDEPFNPPFDFGQTSYEQRGRHFKRKFGVIDVGSMEVQEATFEVDVLVDESNGLFSDVSQFGPDPYTGGNFSLREALLFSDVNPEFDTIVFSPGLRAPGATITVTQGPLSMTESVDIQGPETWILTINGFDQTPLVKNSDGTRIFTIDNDDDEMASDISMSNLTISGGDFAGNGGAIFTRENLTLRGMTLNNNGSSLRGGAIFVEYGNLDLDRVTISNNRAGDDGGGIYINGAAVVDDVEVAPSVLITSSTISGNTAGDRGAGITNNKGLLTVKYSTITNNSSGSTAASGVANFGATALSEFYSTIISGNLNNDIGFFLGAVAASFKSLGYNIVGRGNPGSVANFVLDGDKPGILDPMLDPLAITGGRLATHRPQPGSPAIDMGNPADMVGEPGVPDFDQRGEGFSRVFDDGVNPPRIDIGAYELQPTLLVVDNAGSDDDGDYTMDNLTLVEAINIANLNPLPDTITFNIGNLFGGISAGETVLTITDHLTITGPGSGILTILPGGSGSIFRVDNSDDTVLDVSITGLELRNASAGAVLSREKLTLDDILFVNNSSTTPGGALFHETGDLLVSNTLITGNFTNGLNADGGGVFVRDSDNAHFDNVTVAGNRISQTGSDGAGMAFINSTVTTSFLTVAGNNAPASNSRGAGIFLQDSTLSLLDGVVSSNTTAGSNSVGGGIAAINSHVVVGPNSLININGTLGSQAPGGGIYLSGGSLNVDGAQIAQNFTMGHTSSGGALHLANGASANLSKTVISQNFVNGNGSHGGALANNNGTLTVRDSLINGNEARHSTGKGGGVYSDTNLSNLSTLILNSTVSGNSATLRGGGIFNADGRTDVKHSTITDNSSGSTLNAGAGVASFGNAATTLTTVYSSIIAGNVGAEAGTHTDVDSVEAGFANSFHSLGYNLIGTGNSAIEFIETGDHNDQTDPRLGPLADNTGNEFAAIPLRTHAPLEGSLAVNGGDPGFNPSAYSPSLNLDQRGKNRSQQLRIDIGAHESDLAPGVPADFDNDSDVDGRDFLTWQRNLGNDSATRADGDADGDGVVDGQDLGVWQDNFGSAGGSSIAASAAGSSAALNAAGLSPEGSPNETLSAAATFSEVWAVGSLGTPAGFAASSAGSEARFVEEQAAESQEASLPNALWSSAGRSLLEQEYDFESLALEETADGAAEDAVFAEWGAGLL